MINLDDNESLAQKLKPRDLQPMSVQELETYIVALEDEIARADKMIQKKQSHKNGLDALFGGKKD